MPLLKGDERRFRFFSSRGSALVIASLLIAAAAGSQAQTATPSLTLTVTAEQESAKPGESVNYTVQLINGGLGTANNVTLQLTAPNGAAIIGVKNTPPLTGGTVSQAGSGPAVTWSNLTMTSGLTAQSLVTVRVPDAFTAPIIPITVTAQGPGIQTLTQTVAVTADGPQATPPDPAAPAPQSPAYVAGYSTVISFAADKTEAQLGDTVAVSLDMSNAPDFESGQFIIRFDPQGILKLTGQSAGTFSGFQPDSRSLADIQNSGEIAFGLNGKNSGSGTIGTFTFEVTRSGQTSLKTLQRFTDQTGDAAAGNALTLENGTIYLPDSHSNYILTLYGTDPAAAAEETTLADAEEDAATPGTPNQSPAFAYIPPAITIFAGQASYNTITVTDPDGDPVTIEILGTETPYCHL